MPENSFETQYNLTKRSKLEKYYESNKIFIFSFILILIIILASFSFYLKSKEKKKFLLSENYVQAKIYIEKGNTIEATNLLKNIIFANDSTYSTLSFFLILNHNLVSDHKELSFLFKHLLENNKFESEMKNLLIYKKSLFNSNLANESELLEEIKPLINKETLWRPHALLLLGDYFASKGEYLKAKEFYTQIFSINNLQKDLYDQARSQLALITDD